MEKEFLKKQLMKGLSSRDIANLPEVSINYRTVLYWIKKYDLMGYMKYKKPVYNENYFNKIDTKEKAYILGYTLADGYVTNSSIEYGCAICDKELLDFIAEQLNANVRIDETFIKEKKRFPRCRIAIGNKNLVKDLNKYCCGNKENKTFVRINKNLEPYMLLGFFDGDGCITWGHRKDRGRLWQKVNFTGSFKLLTAIQKLLESLSIASSLHPKGKENCYVLEISSKKSVKAILEYMYGDEDFIVLHRKYEKYNALRLEWDEFGETAECTIPSQAMNHFIEGVETTGEKKGSLNNQLECPSL